VHYIGCGEQLEATNPTTTTTTLDTLSPRAPSTPDGTSDYASATSICTSVTSINDYHSTVSIRRFTFIAFVRTFSFTPALVLPFLFNKLCMRLYV